MHMLAGRLFSYGDRPCILAFAYAALYFTHPTATGVTSSCQVMLSQGADKLHSPLHLQVSEVSESARKAVESAGGSVTTVYYNQLGLRALMTPDWFAAKGRQLPRAARPPAKVGVRYDQVGELPPNIALPA